MIAKSLLAAGLLCASPLFSQDWAKKALEKSPRHAEWIKLKRGERSLDAFIVYPEKRKKATAVVVIHEIFGLTDWARGMADQLAAKGYIAIAPDLLSGFAPDGGRTSGFPSVDAAREAVSKLDQAVVTADLNAAADYVKSLPAANGKVAAAGFCWGGGQAFRFANDRPDLDGAFVFYGPTPADVSKIEAPVFAFYAENDARITAAAPDTVSAMHEAGKKFAFTVFPGAGHGFMRAGEDPAGAPENKAARAQAWKRFLALLKTL